MLDSLLRVGLMVAPMLLAHHGKYFAIAHHLHLHTITSSVYTVRYAWYVIVNSVFYCNMVWSVR
jgi:hypothetical protein